MHAQTTTSQPNTNNPFPNNRGLGAEIARRFAAHNCNIAINYANNAQPAHDLAAELQRAHPGIKTTVIQGDCGNSTDCANCVHSTIAAFGGLDVLIANAGWTRFSDFADLEALSEAEWNKCWATNVLGDERAGQEVPALGRAAHLQREC